MNGHLIVDYGPDLEAEIEAIEEVIQAHQSVRDRFPARWLALELLEDGDDLRVRLAALPGGDPVLAAADESGDRLR